MCVGRYNICSDAARQNGNRKVDILRDTERRLMIEWQTSESVQQTGRFPFACGFLSLRPTISYNFLRSKLFFLLQRYSEEI